MLQCLCLISVCLLQCFAVRSLGWVEMAEEDLAPGKSSVAVNNCIRQLSYCKNDIRDTVGIWGEVRYTHTLSLSHTHTNTFSPLLSHILFSSFSLSHPPPFLLWRIPPRSAPNIAYRCYLLNFENALGRRERNPQGLLSILSVYWAGLAGAFVEEPTLLASLDRVRILRGITLNYTALHPLINTGSPSPVVSECGNTDWPCLHITRQNNMSYLSE